MILSLGYFCLLDLDSEGTSGDVVLAPAHDEHVAAGLAHHVLHVVLEVALVLHDQLLTRTLGAHHTHVHYVVTWGKHAEITLYIT